ncbi:hypothetical protein ACFL6U_13920 [Planctomycetota bacterium]
MHKKYIVRLTKTERKTLEDVIKKLKGTSQKVRRAHILLKADVNGPAWTDARIAEAFDCRVKTIEWIGGSRINFGRHSLVLPCFISSYLFKSMNIPTHTLGTVHAEMRNWPAICSQGGFASSSCRERKRLDQLL